MRITEASEYLGVSINTLKAMADTEAEVLQEIAKGPQEIDFDGI